MKLHRILWVVCAVGVLGMPLSAWADGDEIPSNWAFMSKKEKIEYDNAAVQSARVDESRAKSDYNGALNSKRQTFSKSPELQAAEKAASDAIKEQAAAKAKVLEKLKADSQYASFVKQEADADAKVDALKKKGVKGDDMSAAATAAMRAGSKVSEMERKALADDDAYKTASDKLVEANKNLNDLKTKFEAGLTSDKDLAKLKKAMEDASSKLDKIQRRLVADSASK